MLWLHVISDLLTTAAYYSIPLTLLYFTRQRKDLPYAGVILMCAGFIVACGTTHLMSAITIWIPLYWLDGLVKGFTALLSTATAVMMLWLIPRTLSLPSAAQLQSEIDQRKAVEGALRIANIEMHKNAVRLQLLLDSSPDGIISMDQNGNIIGWNAQAEQIFGYSSEQALGRELAGLIVPPAYREMHRQGVSHLMATDKPSIIGKRIEINGLRENSSEFPMELTIGALGEKDNSLYVAYVRDISERKQSETARQEAFHRLQKIASQLPGVVFQFRLHADGSYSLPYASDVLRDIYRIEPREVRDDAAKVFTVVHPDDLEGHLASIQTSAQDLSPWRNEYRLKFDDGTERWLFGSALPQREENGSVLWHGFVSDITEHKQMEEKLRDSDAFNVSILNSLTSHIAVLNKQGTIIAVNRAWEQFAKENGMPEVSHDTLGFNYLDGGKNAFDQTYGDRANAARTGILSVLMGAQDGFHLEYPCHSPNQQRWFYMNVTPLHGSRQGVVVSHENVTERKIAEQAIINAAHYARSLVEASLDPLVTISTEGKITDVNNATEQVTGIGRDKLIGTDFADNFTEPEKAREAYQLAFSQDFVFDYPLAIRHVSGAITDVLYNASVYFDNNGNVLGVFAAARDITQRKQAELQLRAFYELDLVGLTITSPEKGWVRTNGCLCNMLEYSEQELHQMTWAQLTHPDDLAADEALFEKLLANEIDGYSLEKRFITRTGKVIPTLLVVRGVRKANGELDYVTAMVEDITDFKQAETELKRSNAELEQFAYAISHDMRQPLRMVSSYLSLVENTLEGQLDEETRQFIDFALDGAKRMDAMILSLLDYSRVGRKSEAKTLISSKDALEEALAFLVPDCGCNVEVAGDWPTLVANRDELTRLLQNLIGNALKYHPENCPPVVHVHGMATASSLRVEVRDQGIGIDPSQMDRLFKVFSRLQARSRYEGTGVGLALCRKIVEHHGGTIGVESAGEGQGCVFWFELPLDINSGL